MKNKDWVFCIVFSCGNVSEQVLFSMAGYG